MSKRKNLSEEFKVEDTIQPVADPVMAQALKDEAEKEDKLEKETKEAEKIIDEINNPDEKKFKIKGLSEKLHLDEELDDNEMYDLTHELYKAIEAICRKWVKNSPANYEDFEIAIDEAATKVVDSLPDLWESYSNTSKGKILENYNKQLKALGAQIDRAVEKKTLMEAHDKLVAAFNNFKTIYKRR